MQTARPLSPPFYQISGPASPAARMAGFIILVLHHSCFSIISVTKYSSSDVHLALSAIKALGRQPSGSTVIASDSNLSTLLTVSKNFKESNLEAALEALRCIANALLLIESARATLISDSVNGGEYAVFLLEVGRQDYFPLPANSCRYRNRRHQMSSSSLHASSFLPLRPP